MMLTNKPDPHLAFEPTKDSGLDLLTDEDRISFIRLGGGPRVAPSHSLVHRAFEEHVRRAPERIAVRHRGDAITYGALNARAERVAARLQQLGVRPGDTVALFVERSIAMVVGIFGILKTGAAYVPQDARLVPTSMLEHVATSAGVKAILTLSHLQAKAPHIAQPPVAEPIPVLSIERLAGEHGDAEPATVEQAPDSGCFVLFTSGTTGQPNGVRVTHRNICNILLTAPGNLGMGPGKRVSQILNISFDMCAWEVLGALCHGATLLIRGRDIQQTVARADVVIATPSVLGGLDPRACRNVKTVAVAGEPCPKALADQWSELATFYNACGPTEVTIVNTMHRYRAILANDVEGDFDNSKVSIGTPTPNNTVYILDEDMRPCAIGEIGEMWAGGDCVSDGYVGNPALTQERYKPDPFLGGGRMMFRTRDLARWNENGELEHFGRTDDQVKIRGFRVELDAVSSVLEQVPGCEQAVTLKLDDRNLVSFVRPAGVDVEIARATLERELPYYYIPRSILTLDAFPKTDRGKTDKRSLVIAAVNHQDPQERKDGRKDGGMPWAA